MIDPQPSDIFRSSQVLNNTYEIKGVLGRGGTGEVYCAENLIVGRVVAIKALNARFARNADFLELMKREEAMRNIVHDAVVRYTECSRTDENHVYLVMDYIEGPSLADEMRKRRLGARELMIVAHRVAEGLVAVHDRGIVHRDLSPDNIILRDGDPEQAVIIDFGIAKDTAAGARTVVGNQFAGKYEYAAPEQMEGRTDARSDLYALGATLLAAWRGEVPMQGATPGEILRRKQAPLDTEGVPEPLRSLVGWLTAPSPSERPPDAAAVVARIDAELRPAEAEPAPSRRRRPLFWILLPPAALIVALLAWATGIIAPQRTELLPLADPWQFTAAHAPGSEGRLAGDAPDAAAAETLRAAFREAAGAAPERDELRLARGVPAPDWPEQVAALLRVLSAAERWEVSLSGSSGQVVANTPDAASRDRLRAAVEEWALATDHTVFPDIRAGPERLSAAEVQEVLAPLAGCGPLQQQSDASSSIYAMGEAVTVTGEVSSEDDLRRVEDALALAVGDRPVAVRATVLNPAICAIHAALPPPAEGDPLSIWLGDGATGETNLAGVYAPQQNPVAEVVAPADLEGILSVMLIDLDGNVYHLIPRQSRPEQDLARLGQVSGGVRRVRVLFSAAEFAEDASKVAFAVNSEPGRSEIIALVTSTPLLDVRPGNGESHAAVAEALAAALADRPDAVTAQARRLLETRR